MQGSLNNEAWAFAVPYAFRDSLDIKFEERKSNKNPYMIWTQGPNISFKEGDTIYAKDGTRVVQIQYANAMGWDSAKNQMYEGSVSYIDFAKSSDVISLVGKFTCTQMQLLELLIAGTYLPTTSGV
jgi:hypothetical protein